jgi:hypothetical protein
VSVVVHVSGGAVVEEFDADPVALEVDGFEIQPRDFQEPLGVLPRDLEAVALTEAQSLGVETKGFGEVGDTEADVGEVLNRHGGRAPSERLILVDRVPRGRRELLSDEPSNIVARRD